MVDHFSDGSHGYKGLHSVPYVNDTAHVSDKNVSNPISFYGYSVGRSTNNILVGHREKLELKYVSMQTSH